MCRADRLQIPACLVITSHHEMLTVVDDITCCFVDEGVRPPTEVLTLFKEEYLPADGGEIHCCAQSAQSSADDDRVVFLLFVHKPTVRRTYGSQYDDGLEDSRYSGKQNEFWKRRADSQMVQAGNSVWTYRWKFLGNLFRRRNAMAIRNLIDEESRTRLENTS